MTTKAFIDKLINRLERIEPQQIAEMLQNLLREKNFFEVVIDNIAEGVVVTDPQLKILYINRTAQRQRLILTRKSYQGKSLLNVMPDGCFTDFLLNNSPSSPKPHTQEIVLEKPELACFSVTAYPVTDEETDKLLSLVFILRDITTSRREEQQRLQLEKMSSLATLTAGVAHEIKNPLNSLNINAQLLQSMIQKAASEQKGGRGRKSKVDFSRLDATTGVFMEELKRLADIVEHFLNAVRPSSPDLQPTSLNRIIEHLVEFIRPECEAGKIELKVMLDPETPYLSLDAPQLSQAVMNVLKNALEAIGTEGGRITVRSRLAKDWVRLEIEDDGCGIEHDKLTAIFEPYYTTKFSGSGLGLMNVFRIVREHQGKLQVESEPGRGSCFAISLPLDKKPVRLLSEAPTPENSAKKESSIRAD